MKGFVYFIETSAKALMEDDAPELRDLWGGLRCGSLDGVLVGKIDPLGTREGREPGESMSGILAASSSRPLDFLRFLPDRQTWLDWGDVTVQGRACACWVGVYTDGLPGPAELLRLDALPGVEVLMADNQVWRLPRVLRRVNGRPESVLPGSVTILPNGRLVNLKSTRLQDLERKFEALYEATFAIAEQGEAALTEEAQEVLLRGVIEALAVNYRVRASEIGLLGLLNPALLLPLAYAVVDMDLYGELIEMMKKNGGGWIEAGN